MSIPNEALRKLIQEIENQAIASEREIVLARSQKAAKQRESRLIRLTSEEIIDLGKEANVYQGVGKMFVCVSRQEIERNLSSQAEDVESQIEKLSQKLLYLETTQKNSRQHISQMLRQQ